MATLRSSCFAKHIETWGHASWQPSDPSANNSRSEDQDLESWGLGISPFDQPRYHPFRNLINVVAWKHAAGRMRKSRFQCHETKPHRP